MSENSDNNPNTLEIAGTLHLPRKPSVAAIAVSANPDDRLETPETLHLSRLAPKTELSPDEKAVIYR